MEKKYVCQYCGLSYVNKQSLTRHEGSHNPLLAQYYTCTICPKAIHYQTKSSLVRHNLQKHDSRMKTAIQKNNQVPDIAHSADQLPDDGKNKALDGSFHEMSTAQVPHVGQVITLEGWLNNAPPAQVPCVGQAEIRNLYQVADSGDDDDEMPTHIGLVAMQEHNDFKN